MCFSLKLLGGAALERDGRPVTGRAAHKRRIAVLALLAAARGRALGREKLVGHLWPEHPCDAARHLLSESLYVLRKELGDAAFVAAGDEIALDPAVVGSDLARFEEALERGAWAEAAGLYHGPFLDGFYVSDAPGFERWADAERDRLARAYARALETLATEAEGTGDAPRASEWWRRLLAEDPYSSRTTVRLMRALDGAGERAAAIRQAAIHAALLRGELEAEPDPDVEAFAVRLRADPAPATPVLPPLARSADHLAPNAWRPALDEPTAGGSPDTREDVPVREEGAAASGRPAPPTRARRRWRVPAMLTAGVGAALGFTWVFAGLPAAAGSDASQYVVLPFADRSPRATPVLTPHAAELLLHDALGSWTDLRLVDGMRAQDMVSRSGDVHTLSDALAIARRLGAGKLVWGEYSALPNGILVEAAVYDVADDGRTLNRRSIRVANDLHDAREKFAALASALMRSSAPVGGREAETSSLAASQAFLEGTAALSRWDLDQARAALERAVRLDPGYAGAHLRLAEVLLWDGRPAAEWQDHAVGAAADSAALNRRDRGHAAALVALSERRFPLACRRYAELIARDSSDFAAWYGLGECNAADSLVVPDPKSATGWKFRGSWHVATEAYARALRTVPSSFTATRGAVFARLSSLLVTESRRVRMGYALAPARVSFAAYPSLAGDTVAFVPFRFSDFVELRPAAIPSTRSAAVRHDRELRLAVVSSWVRAFPASAEAHAALSVALESVGTLAAGRQGQPTALSELARARALARDPDQRLRLSVAQTRLWLKLGDFARAAATADSTFGEWRNPGPHDAQRLVPLAVLTGRAAIAGRLLRASAPESIPFAAGNDEVELSDAVVAAYADLLLASAFGFAADADAAELRLERAIRVWSNAAEVEGVRAALLTLPRRMAVERGIRAARRAPLRTADPLIVLEQALSSGDTAAVRKGVARLRELRRDRRPGDQTIDAAVSEVQLLLAAGDTADAADQMDASLTAIAALSSAVLDRVPEAAALPRMMELRAAAALARGNPGEARRWTNALTLLWSSADPPLRQRLARLQAIVLARTPRP
jgi:DNA-binding SARP family transcriptional activator/tetratricopeptide (TPR) repeat protein